MKVGDLVKYNRPTSRDEGKLFLVLDMSDPLHISREVCWVRLDGDSYGFSNGWCTSADLEVVSESG